LRRAGFVKAQRDGQQVFYSVNYTRLKDLTEHANALVETI
jgi:DNA-binding transcriptional ArsR family regulator